MNLICESALKQFSFPYPTDIEEESDYDYAVTILRELSATRTEPESIGDQGRISSTVSIDPDRYQSLNLVCLAFMKVDPEGEIFLDSDAGNLRIEFSPGFTKPPVRAMRCAIDLLRDDILNCCVPLENGYYQVFNRLIGDTGICNFVSHFATADHRTIAYYQLPKGAVFIDDGGLSHTPGSLVQEPVMNQYLAAHPMKDASSADELPYHSIVIDKETMETMLTQLEMHPNKSRTH